MRPHLLAIPLAAAILTWACGGSEPEVNDGPCEASSRVDNATPDRNSTVEVTGVISCNGAPASGLTMLTSWAYKTTTNECSGITNDDGEARCSLPIGNATSDYLVEITVTFEHDGRKYQTSTEFTPKSANVPAATPASNNPLAIGESATLNGIAVTVTAVELEPPARKDSALVSVRIENASDEERSIDFNILCASGASHGRTFYDGPDAFDPAQLVAPGENAQGDLLFDIPAECASPALSAKPTGAFMESNPQESATWSLE